MFKQKLGSNLSLIFTGIKDGNMSESFGDDNQVHANRKRITKILPSLQNASISAEHSSRICDIEHDNPSLKKSSLNFYACDGLFGDIDKCNLWLLPADCIPLVIFSDKSRFCGLVHVSRLNVGTELIKKSINYCLKKTNLSFGDLKVYFGPSISYDSYAFKPEVAKDYFDKSWTSFLDLRPDGVHVDLVGMAIDMLKSSDIKTSQMQFSNIDTASGEYFSNSLGRKSDKYNGRNSAVVYGA